MIFSTKRLPALCCLAAQQEISALYAVKMELKELAEVLVHLGCPSDKSTEMAAQLDKRAKQLAAEKSRSYDEALTHLLTLMRQGWAAKDKGL
jgi:hypothetical protein